MHARAALSILPSFGFLLRVFSFEPVKQANQSRAENRFRQERSDARLLRRRFDLHGIVG